MSAKDPWHGNVPASCSAETSSSTTIYCISSHLFCDGILNCAGGSSNNFGFDEKNCTHSAQPPAKLDPEEIRILEEIKYRKMLRELDRREDEQSSYLMIILGSVVLISIIGACAFYWLIPYVTKVIPDLSKEKAEQNSTPPEYLAHIGKLGYDKINIKSASKVSSKVSMPATLKVKPDG